MTATVALISASTLKPPHLPSTRLPCSGGIVDPRRSPAASPKLSSSAPGGGTGEKALQSSSI